MMWTGHQAPPAREDADRRSNRKAAQRALNRKGQAVAHVLRRIEYLDTTRTEDTTYSVFRSAGGERVGKTCAQSRAAEKHLFSGVSEISRVWFCLRWTLVFLFFSFVCFLFSSFFLPPNWPKKPCPHSSHGGIVGRRRGRRTWTTGATSRLGCRFWIPTPAVLRCATP